MENNVLLSALHFQFPTGGTPAPKSNIYSLVNGLLH